MNENRRLKIVYQEAYKFLSGKVDPKILRQHLEHYHQYKPKTMRDVFRQMVQTLKNKQGYINFIGDVGEMKAILLNFEPKKVHEGYGDDWKALFGKFKNKFGKSHTMDISNKRNAWVIYSKGVLSCAKFLSNFKSARDFDKFVRSFFYNEFTISALPMLLEKEIYGFGFPLSCDFLKELGYFQYGKPDVHLKDIFKALKLVDSGSDYDVFKTIVKIGFIVKQDPVIVDKIFWLIGSGKFHLCDVKIGSQKSAFIHHIKRELSKYK